MKHKFQQFLKNHHTDCESFKYSGGHCSCGRDEMDIVYQSALLLSTVARSALHFVDVDNAYETLLTQIKQFEKLTK